MFKRKLRFVGMAAVLASIPCSLGWADTIMTKSGRTLIGKAVKTAAGYTIVTDDGPETIAADDVKRVILDHAPATPTPVAPVTPGGAAPLKKPVDSKTLTFLLQQATAAYNGNNFNDARDGFADAFLLDPTSVEAGRGLGFSQIRLEHPQKAMKPLEVAAGKSPTPDRSLTVGLAAALVASHNPMRAVKYIKTYFDKHPSPPDEPMLNAMGSALMQTESTAKKSPLFTDALKLYNRLNTDLEATRSGLKRWGATWLPAAEVDKNMTGWMSAQRNVEAANEKVLSDAAALKQTQDQISGLRFTLGRNNNLGTRRVQLEKQESDQQSELDKAQKSLDQLTAELEKWPAPTFPDVVVVEDLTLSGQPTVLAAATHADPADPPTEATRPKTTDHPPVKKTPTVVATKTDEDDPEAKPVSAAAVSTKGTRYAAAFAVAPDLLVTPFSVLADADKIEVDCSDGTSATATVVRVDQGKGLALLKVDGKKFAPLALAAGANTSAIKCLAYPEVNLFNPVAQEMATSLSATSLPWSLHFMKPPRLPGAPLLQGGMVIGIEMADRDSDPAAVPGIDLVELKAFVADDANGRSAVTDPKKAVVQISVEHG